jgi:carbon monoxide dehydrogenase subunit G
MTRVHFTVEIDAPAESVWKVISDPANLPNWDRHIVAVDGVPADGLKVGVRYTTVMGFMGVHARVAARVLEWDPPRRAAIQLTGIVDATVVSTVTALRGHRCRLGHDVDFEFRGGTIGRFAARSMRLVGGAQLALRHGTLAQKRQIESSWGGRSRAARQRHRDQ